MRALRWLELPEPAHVMPRVYTCMPYLPMSAQATHCRHPSQHVPPRVGPSSPPVHQVARITCHMSHVTHHVHACARHPAVDAACCVLCAVCCVLRVRIASPSSSSSWVPLPLQQRQHLHTNSATSQQHTQEQHTNTHRHVIACHGWHGCSSTPMGRDDACCACTCACACPLPVPVRALVLWLVCVRTCMIDIRICQILLIIRQGAQRELRTTSDS